MPRLTVRYWAAARAASGTAEEQLEAGSVLEALDAARALHGERLAAVLTAASVLVDGVRTERSDRTPLPEGAVVEVLPPFAGG